MSKIVLPESKIQIVSASDLNTAVSLFSTQSLRPAYERLRRAIAQRRRAGANTLDTVAATRHLRQAAQHLGTGQFLLARTAIEAGFAAIQQNPLF